MPRNDEMIRQWEILQALDRARGGKTIQELSDDTGRSTRTIRRDLDALGQAGFPLTSTEGPGAHRWGLMRGPGLPQTFTITELSALYFSRTLIECLAETPFQSDLAKAFDKLQKSLSPQMRAFFDRLPSFIGSKVDPQVKLRDTESQARVAKLLQATLDQRQVAMRYHSFKSRKVKDYVIEPYRLVYAQGGLYVIARVPEYDETRTFAIERIETLRTLEQKFVAPAGAGQGVFANSLGVNSGTPTRVEIQFSANAAPYVRERRWHESQALRDGADGSVVMALDVCNDQALHTWILGFGGDAKVLSPDALVKEIRGRLQEALGNYRG